MATYKERFLRDQRARRIAEDHVRRLVAPEAYFNERERLKRVQERMTEMAAIHGCITARDDDVA